MPKLQYRFNNATKDISLYETKPNDKNIAVQIDGKTYYAGLLPVGHSRASNLRILRDGETYAVADNSDKKSLEDYTWAEIATIIKAGEAADYFAVGDTKPVTLGSAILDSGDDVAGTYRVQILGIDHNAEIEGYKRVHFAIGRDEDNTTDICFYGHKMNSTDTNAGGWEACKMRTWLNETFYNLLPTDLRNVITACTKYTDNVGGGNGDIEANVTATSDKIWLMSEVEMLPKNYTSYTNAKYSNVCEWDKNVPYGISKDFRRHSKTHSDLSVSFGDWWTRSPCHNNSTSFACTSGSLGWNASYSTKKIGVVPCFTIS